MKIPHSQRILIMSAMIAAAQSAHANLFSSKGKGNQPLIVSKVQSLEQHSHDLEERVKQLEAVIAEMKAQKDTTSASILSQNQGVVPVKQNAAVDEIELMSQGLERKDSQQQVKAATQEALDTSSEAGLYGKITRLIERRDYQKAQNSAQTYMQTFSGEKNAPTVLFWLGEIKMLFGELAEAKTYYMQSLNLLKGKGRTPEILLKIAVISYQKGETEEGDRYYDQLQKIYPGSTASHMARTQRKKYRSVGSS